MNDPMRFIIPCFVGSEFSYNALCNLGTSISLISLSTNKRLGLGEVKLTTVKLQLADRSYIFSSGEIEDILVKVDKFIVPTNFVVLDMEEEKDVSIIMGRPFLITGRTLIDEEQVVLNIFKTMD